ncbi:MAG: GNAT family N-acetyltransferase [Candidatus Hodarchaeota archaeon]
MNLKIRRASEKDATFLQQKFPKRTRGEELKDYFIECYDRQEKGEMVLLAAEIDGNYVGYVKVLWQSVYAFFRENNIPEINDLFVETEYRRKGIATRLVGEAENIIRNRSKIAGIGFGMYVDYGPAQRMYVLRGYVPDGKGLIYKDDYVKPGEVVPVDDDLILFLIKKLRVSSKAYKIPQLRM